MIRGRSTGRSTAYLAPAILNKRAALSVQKTAGRIEILRFPVATRRFGQEKRSPFNQMALVFDPNNVGFYRKCSLCIPNHH